MLVRIERLDGGGVSNNFRVRALKPTVVYGDNAAAINTEQGCGERLRDAAELRELSLTVQGRRERYRAARSLFHARSLHDAGLVHRGTALRLRAGRCERARDLVKDELSNSKFERFVIANLHLEDVSITQATASTNWPSWFNVSHHAVLRNQRSERHGQSERPHRETRDHRVVVDGIEGHGRQGQRAPFFLSGDAARLAPLRQQPALHGLAGIELREVHKSGRADPAQPRST